MNNNIKRKVKSQKDLFTYLTTTIDQIRYRIYFSILKVDSYFRLIGVLQGFILGFH